MFYFAERADNDYMNEAMLFQSHRLAPSSDPHSTRKLNNSDNDKQILKDRDIMKGPNVGSIDPDKSFVGATSNEVNRRRRGKKRPGVFLVPTTIYSSNSYASPSLSSSSRAASNSFQSTNTARSASFRHTSSSSSSSSATHSSLFQTINLESAVGASERINRTLAAVLMKQQYHR